MKRPFPEPSSAIDFDTRRGIGSMMRAWPTSLVEAFWITLARQP
jgi:hypothetical protein